MVGFTPQRLLSCGIHALQGCLLVALRQGSAHEVVAVVAQLRFTLLDTFHFSLYFEWLSVTESH
jgi:hypothetical protein